MFVNFKKILTFSLIIICFGCKNDDTNTVRKPNYGGKPINSEDTSTFDPDEFDSYESDLNSHKSVEWADGNIYTYDYTEQIETKDSLGNIKVFTIYKRNKPSNIDCETKECRWCGKGLYAENYSIEEYPDINGLRGKGSLMSLFSLFMSLFNYQVYYDLDNNRIRTEWRVNCDYSGPNGFCSLKCQSEYNNR